MYNENETNTDKVLRYLNEMKGKSGYVLNPIALAHFVSEEMEKREIKATNAPETARNVAYLYACLCNEYMLAANSELTRETGEFYVSDWKWGKYKIGRKLKKDKISLLADLEWITYRYAYHHGYRNLYKIRVDKLRRMTERAKGFRSEKAIDDWNETFFKDKPQSKITCKAVDEQMTEFLENNKMEDN